MTETAGQRWGVIQAGRSVIDCDVHVNVPGIEVLLPYLDDYWREVCTQSGFRGPVDTSYPAGVPTSARPGTWPTSGGPPGSDLALIRAHVLDAWNVDFAILNCWSLSKASAIRTRRRRSRAPSTIG